MNSYIDFLCAGVPFALHVNMKRKKKGYTVPNKTTFRVICVQRSEEMDAKYTDVKEMRFFTSNISPLSILWCIYL